MSPWGRDPRLPGTPSQVVLLDSRFAGLPAVVAEGRRVIGNVEQVAKLFVTKTVYACLLAIAVGVAQRPFPFFAAHLTLVSSLTIGIPAFVLALSPSERRVEPRFLRRVLGTALPAGSSRPRDVLRLRARPPRRTESGREPHRGDARAVRCRDVGAVDRRSTA